MLSAIFRIPARFEKWPFLLYAAVLAGMGGVAAHGQKIFEVRPSDSNLSIPFTALLSEDPQEAWVSDWSLPRHGKLQEVPNGLSFVPGESFWTLGIDRFTYRLEGAAGGRYATAVLIATFLGGPFAREDFESGSSQHTLAPGYSWQILPQAAIGGKWGLRLEVGGLVTSGGAGEPPALMTFTAGSGGDGPDSAGDCMRILIPPITEEVPVSDELILFSIGSIFGQPAARLRLRLPQSELRAEMADRSGALHTSPWLPLGDGAKSLHLDVWRADSRGGSGGLLLRLDDAFAARLPNQPGTMIDNADANLRGNQFFLLEGELGGSWSLDIDDLGFYRGWGKAGVPAVEPLLAEDFESGNLDAWSNGATTELRAAPEAALSGNWGLAVDLDVDLPGPKAVIDNSPSATARYGARFRLHTQTMTMSEGDSFLLFSGSAVDGAAPSHTHLQVWLRSHGGALQLSANHRELAGGKVRTGWIDLEPGERLIELQWRAASKPGQPNGGLRLWADGVLLGELDDLDNGDMTIESVRLGAKGVDAGTGGVLFLDDFLSWGEPKPIL